MNELALFAGGSRRRNGYSNMGIKRGKMDRPLTPAMLAMLRSASAGLPLKTGLHGMSAHGGAEWTIVALRKRGYLKGYEITAEGLAAALRVILNRDR